MREDGLGVLSLAPATATLGAGLEALGEAVLLLDAAGRVAYLTAAAARLLGVDAQPVVGRAWAAWWAELCPDTPALEPEPRRLAVRRGAQTLAVRVWQRPIAGTSLALVGLEDLTAEDEREREVL